jgi:hypothetical protein
MGPHKNWGVNVGSAEVIFLCFECVWYCGSCCGLKKVVL